jgi:uncharacterized protein (TIGR03086 family)
MTEVLPYADQAVEACRNALAGVSVSDLDRRTPCAEFTVRELADHLRRSMLLLSAIAGSELSDDPELPLADSITALAQGAVLAWRQRGTDGEVAVGRTITPARLAAEIVTLELVVHAWDVARAVGSDVEASDELCAHLLAQARELITDDKRGRSFAPAVDTAADASPLHRLVAFTGRTP